MVGHFGRPLGWDEMAETFENKFHKSHLCKWCSLSDYAGTPPRELPIAQSSLSDSMLSEWKPLLIVWILPFPLNPSRDQQKRGNTLCWERMQSPTNSIRNTKISYSITSSLLFHKFLCRTYRNSLNHGTTKLRHLIYLKKYEPC